MKRKQWMLGVLSILFCAMITLVDPVRTEAASQTDRSAYNEVFDASYYYSAYPDVAAAFGMNEKALFEHFVNYGVREGRSGSAEFNPQVYRQNYSDLQAAFGDDMAAYCRHYVRYGRAEGRSAGGSGQVSVPAGTSALEKNHPNPQAAQNGIGTCTTAYNANVPRANNVELAAARINGVIVQPGGSFSFSNTVLPRTAANGYVKAPIFVSGKTGVGVGGGICQVSSTLYAAMVYAGLPATERHPHSRSVDYLPRGLDATISGNYLDLKFTNIFAQPLLIQASAQGGQLTVTLVLQQ